MCISYIVICVPWALANEGYKVGDEGSRVSEKIVIIEDNTFKLTINLTNNNGKKHSYERNIRPRLITAHLQNIDIHNFGLVKINFAMLKLKLQKTPWVSHNVKNTNLAIINNTDEVWWKFMTSFEWQKFSNIKLYTCRHHHYSQPDNPPLIVGTILWTSRGTRNHHWLEFQVLRLSKMIGPQWHSGGGRSGG